MVAHRRRHHPVGRDRGHPEDQWARGGESPEGEGEVHRDVEACSWWVGGGELPGLSALELGEQSLIRLEGDLDHASPWDQPALERTDPDRVGVPGLLLARLVHDDDAAVDEKDLAEPADLLDLVGLALDGERDLATDPHDNRIVLSGGFSAAQPRGVEEPLGTRSPTPVSVFHGHLGEIGPRCP